MDNTDAQAAMNIVHTNVLGIPQYTGSIPIAQNGLMKGEHIIRSINMPNTNKLVL